mmetsp:Transcript_1689/g.4292  ORF Transcript_1689/g.4292 Transcript_1689/m.4292 type:complete len:119 (+) Transcript_1689:38-394(+)
MSHEGAHHHLDVGLRLDGFIERQSAVVVPVGEKEGVGDEVAKRLAVDPSPGLIQVDVGHPRQGQHVRDELAEFALVDVTALVEVEERKVSARGVVGSTDDENDGDGERCSQPFHRRRG